MPTIAIVGHGPSILNSNLGNIINSYDIVIRQKAISASLVSNAPKDYGTKTSIICGSYTIKEALFWNSKSKIWVFMDSRHEKIVPTIDTRFTLLPDLCKHWNSLYRQLRSSNYNRNKQMTTHATSSELGHNHMSCGLHTIIYACDILKPEKISLFGFDNIKNGDFTWSVTRGKSWNEYPDHRWDTEKEMLKLISNNYYVNFEFIP